ncbi:MAG TPA: hypothetical protein VN541_10470 [Tepidisphaeraceae bacterium]|nr:hypothetical protein [Tepidisphaeraceae bacterium]
MKMTRERKVYAALFALAVVALGVDKFVLGPPESQAAVSAETQVASAPPAHSETHPEVPTAARPTQPGLAALTLQMDQVNRTLGLESADIPDLFQAPAGWLKPAAAKQPVDAAATFSAQHHLLAVLKSSRGGVAVIGGATLRKSLRIGQQVDGFKLTAIGERSATFTSGQQKVELQLPTDSSPDSQIISTAGR